MGFLKKKGGVKKAVGLTLLLVGLVYFYLSGGFGLLLTIISGFKFGGIFTPEGFEEKEVSGSKIVYEISEVKPIEIYETFCPGKNNPNSNFGWDSYYGFCFCKELWSGGYERCAEECEKYGAVMVNGSISWTDADLYCKKVKGYNYGEYGHEKITLTLSLKAKNKEIPPNATISIPIEVNAKANDLFYWIEHQVEWWCIPPPIVQRKYSQETIETNCHNAKERHRIKTWDDVVFKIFVDGKFVKEYSSATLNGHWLRPRDFQLVKRGCSSFGCWDSHAKRDFIFNITLSKEELEKAGIYYGGYHTVRIDYEVVKSNLSEVLAIEVKGYNGEVKKKYLVSSLTGTLLDGLQFYKEPDECTIPPGYALVTEDFKGGTTISKSSFTRPVVAFCNSYPIMKMDSSGKTLNKYSTKELELLRDGSYVTVPSGEVWKIMYVAKISDLTRACKPGEYVDENGNCIPLPAFEYYCSSGTYDPDKHACLVQPVTRCIEGSYNEETGMCEKIISPEEVIIRCPEGSELKVLDDGTKVCIFEPVPICEKGVLTQDELGREICAYFPEVVNLAGSQKNIEVGEIPDELHVRTYTCPVVDGRMIFIETFAGGKEVNKYSFRYPVNFFCKVHPVIITTADGRTYKRSDIYDRIVAGETLTIPEDETWTFFYVGYANQQLPLVCKDGALRITEDKIECVVQPGIVHVCSEGQFDPVRGLCVVQPESKAVCESGYYDAEKKVCIWHPPLQAVCEKGLYNPDTKLCEWKPKTIIECEGNYDEERGVCVVTPTTIIKCQRGYYDEKADVCRYTPKEEIVCKEPYVYNPQTQKCEYRPPEKVKCEMGVWNEQTQACEYAGEIRYVCEEGTFDKATKTCIVKPPIYYKCERGTYNKDRGVCEYTPVAEAKCERGKYDPATDKCIYIPREYVICEGVYDEKTGRCIVKMTPEYECDGEIVGDKCIIRPEPKIICPGKSHWDEEQKACILEGEVKIVCPEGSELVDGECVSRKALVVSYDAMQIISGAMIIVGAVLLFL